MTKEHVLSKEEALKLGIESHSSGKLQEAYNIYQSILRITPNDTQVLHLLGVLAMQTENHDAATQVFNKVLEIDPAHINALYHLGVIERDRGNFESALETLAKLLEIKPNHYDARFETALCLQKLDRTLEAIEQFKIIIENKPTHMAAGNLLAIYMHSCMWDEFAKFTPVMDRLNKEAIKAGSLPGEILSTNIARVDNPKINLQIAKCHSKAIENKVVSKINFDFAHRGQPNKKLTIGYLCNNFNNHPTGHLICRLFEKHNREKFNIIAYSHSKPDDYYYPTIAAGCDKMVNITILTDMQVARQIYQDEVDILIDLKGHTPEARLAIFAYRPAPIQITYLGFPGTSGADFFDYMITDKIVSPPEHAQYYSEKLFYMPDCYQINDSNQRISDKVYSRAELGLPEKGFIFSSFNQCYKIDPIMFDVWCRLLEKVPNSVLWLLNNDKIAVQNLKIEATARGINTDRLIFAELLNNKSEHLARIQLADLALDTRICGGHTTSSDMLWAGVPIVTMLGKHFASRVCSSLLSAIDMQELITNNLKEYEALCLNLAQNPERLSSLKQKLAENKNSKPLFDTEKFAKHLEIGCVEAWNRFVIGDTTKKPIEC